MAVPAYQDYTLRAKSSGVILSMSGARIALAERMADNPKAGLLTADEVTKIKSSVTASQYIESVDVYATEQYADVVVTANAGNNAQGHIYMVTRDGGKNWTCGSTNFPGKYLPSSCRDKEGNNRPAPPKQSANIGMWERSFAQNTYNGCVRSRTKDDPNGAETFCECMVSKVASVVPQTDMVREPKSDEARQAIQTASQACVDH